MGITDDDHEMSRLSNGGDEESLPLYSEVGAAPKEGPTAVPEATATPDEVRDFFKSLIVANRSDVNGEDAEAIAARWSRGSGKELKSYPPQMYLKIFGPEDGWFLYKETQLIMRRAKQVDAKKAKAVHYAVVAFMLSFEAAMLAIVLFSYNAVLTVIGIFAGIFGFFGLLIAAAVACSPISNVEDVIEAELRKCMERGVEEARS